MRFHDSEEESQGKTAAWRLPGTHRVVGYARSLTRDTLTKWGLAGAIEDTQLLVSELVTNAVTHSSGPIELRLHFDKALRCEVTDTTPGEPEARSATEDDESGRGLHLIEALADQWGTIPTATGKTVWFEKQLVTSSR